MAPRSISRSTSPPDEGDRTLVVGLIKGPHGVRGEVRVDPRSDVPERFRAGAVLECEGIGPLRIVSVRGTAVAPVIRFAGYTSRPEADALRDRFLRVGIADARRATAGRYLWADLVGLRAVSPAGEDIGTVRDVLRAGSADVLVVARAAGGELLVPAIGSVVRDVDLAAGTVVVTPQEEL
jgi:16S rRNA processing protein RimM